MILQTPNDWHIYYTAPSQFNALFADYKKLKNMDVLTPDQEIQFDVVSTLIDGHMAI